MSGATDLTVRGAAVVLALAAVLLTGAPVAAEKATGVVYEDRNGNGVLDAGDPVLPDVRVSDGRDVVVTDAGGRYRIDIEDEAVVFIVKPRGYRTAVSDDMLPRFYYVHQPKGSPPGMRYPGVEPTGPLPESIDFALTRQEEPRRFEAILFADPQPQTSAEVDYLRDDIVSELIGTSARFGMTMGDLLFDDLALFPRYNAVVGEIGIPWYNVPGNHELNFEAEDDRYSLETFKRYFGPSYYSFDYADAHFVVLDNIEYQGNGQADPADFRQNGGYESRIGKRQLRWLERDLSHVPTDTLVFLAMHSPLRSFLGKPDNPSVNTQDREKLFDLLEGRPNLYAVAGHTHTTEHHYFGKEDGFEGPGTFHHHVLATASGSWWSGPLDDRGIPVAEQRDGTPNGYHVLEVDGSELAVRYQAAGKPADYQMRILFDVAYHSGEAVFPSFRHGELFDGRMTADEARSAVVVVNFFDGGERSRVEMQVGGGEWTPMTRREQVDPYVEELYARHRDAVKSWVEPLRSSHIWFADLADELSPGVYTVSVRATDEFGRTHHAHRVVEIEGSVSPWVLE